MSISTFESFVPTEVISTNRPIEQLAGRDKLNYTILNFETEFLRSLIESAGMVNGEGHLEILDRDQFGVNTMIDIMRVMSPSGTTLRRQDEIRLAGIIINHGGAIAPILDRIKIDPIQRGKIDGIVATTLVDFFLSFRSATSPLSSSLAPESIHAAARFREYRNEIQNSFPEVWVPRAISQTTGILPPVMSVTRPN